MADVSLKPSEVILTTDEVKTVYHFVDTLRNIDIPCKEIYKKENKQVHFPFIADTGQPKYGSIKRLVYIGLSEDLPAGFLKSFKTGYGFTRELAPLLYAVSSAYPAVEEIIITQKTPVCVSGNTVTLNMNFLKSARPKISSLLNKHKQEKYVLINNILSEIFPEKFTAKTTKYTPGVLSNFSDQLKLEKGDLSQEDVNSLLKLLPYGIKYEAAKLLQTKREVDYALIEDLLSKYKKLLSIKTKSRKLEEKWQNFFEENILYFNFGYVEKFNKERIQGDKKINIPDFIMLNNYGYLDVFEIKTHLTNLLSYDVGRKNFYWTAEAAKALSQAENYIDGITKEEDTLIKNIRDEYGIEVDAVRPVVYVIASTKEHLTTKRCTGGMAKKLKNDFRRLNNSLKNVRIILYDELLDSFENMLKTLDKKQTV